MRAWPLLFWLWTMLLLPTRGERPRLSVFQFVGPTNRLLTPNGDGKNDKVFLMFENPAASEVKATIYDLKGKVVSGLPVEITQCNGDPFETRGCAVWDGKAAGTVVPGGVYVYVLEVESTNFSGTVVVIK